MEGHVRLHSPLIVFLCSRETWVLLWLINSCLWVQGKCRRTKRPRAAESCFCSALLNESCLHLLFIIFGWFSSIYRNPEAVSYWHCGEGRNRALPLVRVAGILHETPMFLCHCLRCCPGHPGTRYIDGDCLKLRVWLWNIGIKSLCYCA